VIITLVTVSSQSAYNIYIYNSMLLACMGAISLQVLQGTTGLPSIGTAAFLLFGAFGSVWFLRQGVPFPLDLVGGALFAGVAGIIFGIPALRLRGLFFALSTLSAHFIAVFLGNFYQKQVPEGTHGFSIPILFGSYDLETARRYTAWMMCAIVALLVLVVSRLMQERSGRALRMIRDHEHIAPTLGIAVARYKLLVFTLTSVVIGLEGALLARLNGLASAENYTVALAFQYIAMIVIGGLGSLPGAVIGATIVVGLPAVLPDLITPLMGESQANADGPNFALIIYGLLVIFVVSSSPDGAIGLARSVASRFTRAVAAIDRTKR